MSEIEQEYWKTAEVPLDSYPEIDENSVEFPDDIYVAFAVCQKECGGAEFIVDGSTQICDRCGKLMFRTEVRRYRLADLSDPPAQVDIRGIWIEVDKKGHPKT